MMSATPEIRTKSRLFFAIAFAWSVLFWTIAVVSGGIHRSPGLYLQYFGGAGPVVAALAVVYLFEQPIVRRDFWSRLFNIQRMPWRWVVVALLLHPLILLVALGADQLLGTTLQLQTVASEGWASILRLVVFVFVFGPLPEEAGWRGIAYDRLERRFSPFAASILLGVAWAVWHIPLFFIEGTFQNHLGVGSLRFWVFLLSNVPLTVIMSWVYHRTERSTLSAVIIHFSGNMVGALVVKTDRAAVFELVGLAVVAMVILVFSGVGLGRDRDTLAKTPVKET